MAGIQDPNVVDVVGQGPDGTYLVIMIEERPWGADPEQPRQVREKTNAYAAFILDGTLATQYPETAGRRVCIQLNCREAPTGEIATIADHARTQLDKLGIAFNVRVLPQPDTAATSRQSL